MTRTSTRAIKLIPRLRNGRHYSTFAYYFTRQNINRLMIIDTSEFPKVSIKMADGDFYFLVASYYSNRAVSLCDALKYFLLSHNATA